MIIKHTFPLDGEYQIAGGWRTRAVAAERT